MPEILILGAEGEQTLFENALSPVGADDKRRGSVWLTSGQQMYRQFAATYADMWFHVRFAVGASESADVGQVLPIVEVGNATRGLVRIRNAGSVGDVANIIFDVAAIPTGTGYVSSPAIQQAKDAFTNYDIHIQVNPSNMVVRIYRNEVLRHFVTIADVFTAPDRFLIQPKNNVARSSSVWVQDVIATDSLPTVGMELATLVPSAVGSYSQFTNDYSAIDDEGYDQSSVISSTTPGDRESWFLSDPEFDLGDKVIYGVAMLTVAQTDIAGIITDFAPFLRIDAVNYPSASIGADTSAPNAYVSIFTQNPSTGAPWQQAELVGLEAGIRAV